MGQETKHRGHRLLHWVLLCAAALALGTIAALPLDEGEQPRHVEVNSGRATTLASIERLAGADRVETAAAIAAARFPDSSEQAFVATGNDFPDALAAGAAAGATGSPVLLTERTRLPASTASELRRLDPDEVLVIGGEAAITPQTMEEIADIATQVRRIAGGDRFTTAAHVATASFDGPAPVVSVATGETFPDALTGGVAAMHQGGPLVLTGQDRLPEVTAQALDRLQPRRIVVLGGVTAVTETVLEELADFTSGQVTRLAGADRYKTGVAVARSLFPSGADVVFVTTGQNFPDALAGGPAAAQAEAPLFLVPPDGVPPVVAQEIANLGACKVVVLGGPQAVSQANATRLSDASTCAAPPGGTEDDVENEPDDSVDDGDVAADRTFSGAVQEPNGFTVPSGETWEFDPHATTTVTVTENIVVKGTLRMKPSSADVTHTLRFEDVDEELYEGGGMEVLDSDVGLWVVGNGVLDSHGSQRTGWARLSGPASEGDTALELLEEPVGWRRGDRLLVLPTAPGETKPADFDVHTIAAVHGSTVELSEPLTRDRPSIAETTAEVANLTRNVRIEGTGDGESSNDSNGRAHVLIMSDQPQHISHAAFRLLGPRQPTGKTYKGGGEKIPIHDGVLGRYPLHFHHMGNDSRGTLVEGVVVERAGNHAIVPHSSHGITIRDTVAYDTWESAFWWDPSKDGNRSNDSHDVLWEHDLVAVVRGDPSFRGHRLTGYRLGAGEPLSNVLTTSVAAGIQGTTDAAGYKWPEKGQGVWQFDGNVSHNNVVDGLFVWQNNSNPHVIEDFVAYSNGGAGIDHGAYRNVYTYRDVVLFENRWGIKHLANGHEGTQTWENVSTDADIRLLHHNLPAEGDVVYADLNLRDDAKIQVDESGEPGTFLFRSSTAGRDLTREDFRVENCISDIRIITADGAEIQVC